jgi:lysyl-tRNA synthetase class 2
MESGSHAQDGQRRNRIKDLVQGRDGWIAGRLLRDGGRSFLADETGRVQLDAAGSAEHGAILEVHGRLEEDRFRVAELRTLTQALRPWPGRPGRQWQRWLGDARFRRGLRLRAGLLRRVREFFYERDFLEVDTPALMSVPGMEPHLDPFATELRHPDGRRRAAYLHTSPEYAMKKLLCGGCERLFQICHVWRNAELSRWHQPEFVLLEWYRAYASYEQIMSDCEELLRAVALAVRGEAAVEAGGRRVELAGPFERLSVAGALARYSLGRPEASAGPELFEPDAIRRMALERGLFRPGQGAEPDPRDLFFQLLLNDAEPQLGRDRPTFLLDWPRWQAALARLRGEVAERVELYVAGVELANGFSELTDAAEQRRRFEAEAEQRRRLGKQAALDEEFLAALEWGMPPAAGIALGVDRLVALMAGTADVAEVTLFPFQERFGEA